MLHAVDVGLPLLFSYVGMENFEISASGSQNQRAASAPHSVTVGLEGLEPSPRGP